MFSKFQGVLETSTACFEVLGMRGKETVSEAASVTSYGDYMPSLQRQKKKIRQTLFCNLFSKTTVKKSDFQTFKVPDSIKNKTEQFPRAKKCPLLSLNINKERNCQKNQNWAMETRMKKV